MKISNQATQQSGEGKGIHILCQKRRCVLLYKLSTPIMSFIAVVHWIAIFDPERGSRSIFCGSVSNLDTISTCLDRNGSYRPFLGGIFDPLSRGEYSLIRPKNHRAFFFTVMGAWMALHSTPFLQQRKETLQLHFHFPPQFSPWISTRFPQLTDLYRIWSGSYRI